MGDIPCGPQWTIKQFWGGRLNNKVAGYWAMALGDVDLALKTSAQALNDLGDYHASANITIWTLRDQKGSVQNTYWTQLENKGLRRTEAEIQRQRVTGHLR